MINVNIRPFARYIAKSTYFIADTELVANDCRILYIVSGNGVFTASDQSYELTSGTLVYYPCGTRYRISSDEKNPISFYTVNFDFSQDNIGIPPMAPVPLNKYDSSKLLYTVTAAEDEAFCNVIYLRGASWCEYDLKRMLDERILCKDGSQELQNVLMKVVLMNISRHLSKPCVNALCDRIKAILSDDLSLTNVEIAKKVGYHPFYINEVFKKHEKITLHRFVLEQKLARSYRLIASTQMTIEEIAFTCGFSSLSYFSTSFKKHYGIAPTDVRKLV